jgi:cellulose synthase (UDP-forming)
VPIVFAAPPSPDDVRAAALVAGWFGMRTDQPVRFPIYYGALPDTSAIYVGTRAGAAALGLPADDRPAVRLLPHPRGPERKVLVVSGPDAAGLEAAALGFARTTPPLSGQVVAFGPSAPAAERAPYDAPRWQPAGRDLRFGDVEGGDRLVHRGATGGTLRLPFRVAPDLFPWPETHVRLDLTYRVHRSPGLPPPRLAVELDGRFVSTLPADDDGWRTARLRLAAVRGRGELRVHVEYPACADAPGEPPEVAISPDSRLRLADVPHFARLPDVDRFVFDGFPFTRRPDLAETALVLPDAPRPAEVGAALSWVARFAAVTGVPGERLTVVTASGVEPGLDADLLVVEAVDRAGTWLDDVPLAVRDGRIEPRAPSVADWWSSLAAARWPLGERARAEALLDDGGPVGAITGGESPLKPGRTVVLVTGTAPASDAATASLPDAVAAHGPADRREARGDLLLVSGRRRALFALGAGYDVGDVSAWTRVRWYLAGHWVVLFGAMFVGVGGTSFAMRRVLARNHAKRLADPGGDPRCPPA